MPCTSPPNTSGWRLSKTEEGLDRADQTRTTPLRTIRIEAADSKQGLAVTVTVEQAVGLGKTKTFTASIGTGVSAWDLRLVEYVGQKLFDDALKPWLPSAPVASRVPDIPSRWTVSHFEGLNALDIVDDLGFAAVATDDDTLSHFNGVFGDPADLLSALGFETRW